MNKLKYNYKAADCSTINKSEIFGNDKNVSVRFKFKMIYQYIGPLSSHSKNMHIYNRLENTFLTNCWMKTSKRHVNNSNLVKEYLCVCLYVNSYLYLNEESWEKYAQF